MGTLVKQSQATVKQNNLRLLLAAIIRHEPLSRADLVRRTQISKPTVSSLIDELRQRGLISEIGVGPARSGRKPILLRFESDRRRFLAFEMGRAGFRIALADLKGRILNLKEGFFPPPEQDPSAATLRGRLELLRGSILAALEESETEPRRLLKGICIAPGVCVEPGQALRWMPAAASGNGDASWPDLSQYFRSLLGCDVLLYHSTKAALLGEKVAGKATGCSSALYVDFAYGLGCALMIDGKVYSGPGDSAGEIGYFYSSREEHESLAIRPFELGALEQHISGKALADKAREELQANPGGTIATLAAAEGGPTARHVFEAYRKRDPRAAAILTEAFGYFNTALCNVINLIAPQRVIFGGGFSESGDLLLELIAPGLRDKVLIPPRLEISELRGQASLIGGIHHLIEHTDFLAELRRSPVHPLGDTA